jgi:hypothetical protein
MLFHVQKIQLVILCVICIPYCHLHRYLFAVRLWSLQTNSNLVVYKGHNFPVWDVDFSPVGVYFVSGSYDRTAKLWSTDSINPLRIFVGHTGDVDVRRSLLFCLWRAVIGLTMRLLDCQIPSK